MTHYPKAYLRIDPNIDQVRTDLNSFVRLLCAANRQPRRGYFKSEDIARMVLGKAAFHRAASGGDLVSCADGSIYVDGWTEWQEGDLNVGERMRVLRARKRGDEAPYAREPRSAAAERTANWRLRTRIFERDNWTCQYCGTSANRDWLVVDHIIPQPDGPTTEDNLVTACRSCNKRKGGRTPEQAGMPLAVTVMRRATSNGDESQRIPPSEASGVFSSSNEEESELAVTAKDNGRLREPDLGKIGALKAGILETLASPRAAPKPVRTKR